MAVDISDKEIPTQKPNHAPEYARVPAPVRIRGTMIFYTFVRRLVCRLLRITIIAGIRRADG
jgi:hypothetical protein